jgi:AcrR family transcriptional regulator
MAPNEKDTRSRIIIAAQAIFSEKGYTKTGVADITERADIAKGSFYTYFKNKHDIFLVILDQFIRELDEILGTMDTKSITDMVSYKAQSVALGMAIAAHFLQNRELARLFFWEAMGLDPDMEQRIDGAYAMISAHVGKLVGRGVKLGLLRKEVSGDLLVDAIVGFGTYVIRRYLKGAYNNLPVQRILEEISLIHFSGVSAADDENRY